MTAGPEVTPSSRSAEMKVVLCEEWEKITIDEINYEIEKLPTIVPYYLAMNGSNNFHA